MADSRGRVAVCLLLLAAVAAVYEPVRHHAFVGLDDALFISANPHLRHGLTPDGLAWAFSVPDNENWIPLTQISYLIDYELHGLRPGPILLANAALHALAAVVLFLALARMTGAPGRCAFVAAVFAVHPLHVESVAWAAERKDVLSALCFATTLWCYARYAERPTPGRYGAVAAALALGLLSKPMLVTAPFVLLLLDHWPLRRRALLEKLPLLALAAGSAAVTLVALRGTLAPEVLSLGLRLENATVSTATYLAAALWPSGLSIFYPYPVDGLPAARVAVSALVVAVPTALSLYALSARRWPWLPVGWFWYLGMLVPVVGILQAGAQARADRYTYLPLIGASIAGVWALHAAAARRPALQRGVAALGVAALLAFAVAARGQVGHWRDSVTLFGHAVAMDDENAMAHNLLAAGLQAAGRPDEALPHFRRALGLRPELSPAHAGLGEILHAKGHLDAAVREYRASLEGRPGHARTRANLGAALVEKGEYALAAPHLDEALRLGLPGNAGDSDPSLANVHANLGQALRGMGRREEAIRQLENALAIAPEDAGVHANLGFALLEAGRREDARRHLERAVGLGADAPEVQLALASESGREGRIAEAIRHYRSALTLRPDWLPAANNLAWILATAPDPAQRDSAEAVRIATGIAAGEGARHPATLDTLATAYAADGRFDEAVRTAARARDLARSLGEPELADEIEARRRLFAAGERFVSRPR